MHFCPLGETCSQADRLCPRTLVFFHNLLVTRLVKDEAIGLRTDLPSTIFACRAQYLSPWMLYLRLFRGVRGHGSPCSTKWQAEVTSCPETVVFVHNLCRIGRVSLEVTGRRTDFPSTIFACRLQYLIPWILYSRLFRVRRVHGTPCSSKGQTEATVSPKTVVLVHNLCRIGRAIFEATGLRTVFPWTIFACRLQYLIP